MRLDTFEKIVAAVKARGTRRRVALVEAQDPHALEAVLEARADGLVEPVLVGNRAKILAAAQSLAAGNGGQDPSVFDLSLVRIVEAEDEAESARAGVALVRAGEADFLMKGKLQTADLLRAVVDRETGLRTAAGSVMSHLAFFQIPGKDRLFVATDGGMLLYPDLAQKKQIVVNAVSALHALGYETPLVAILAAVETVNGKMPETLDGAELKRMNAAGEIPGCIIEGPISYDLAMDAGSASIKGYTSPVAGKADVLVVPNITAGNILGKSLVFAAGARMAGIIAGAAAPVVLTSRGATSEEKYLSLALAAAVSR